MHLNFFPRVRCAVCKGNCKSSLIWAANAMQENAKGEYQPNERRFCGLFICESCRSPAFIEFDIHKDKALGANPLAVLNRIAHPQKAGLRPEISVHAAQPIRLDSIATIVRVYGGEAAQPPAHLPLDIDANWREELHTASTPRQRVFICRMLLEQMCAERGATTGNLASRIDALADKLSPAVTEWAHTVRLLGNVAVHEPTTTIDLDDSLELVEFTRTLAELLYTIPARIQRQREAREKAKAAKNQPAPT